MGDLHTLPAQLVDGEYVMVEIHYDATARSSLTPQLQTQGVRILHDIVRGSWMEAWIPISALPRIVESDGIHRVQLARLVELENEGTTTQGVELANVQAWHDQGIDGFGITIAVIDAFRDGNGEIAALQATGDWPPDDQLEQVITFEGADGQVFHGCDSAHGNAVMEIVYDMAPGANFIAYDVCAAGSWIAAIEMAIDAGADIITASLGQLAGSVGDGTALPGSVGEAYEIAADAGIMSVTSAGNLRLRHWGGLYNPHESGWNDYPDVHLWGQTGWYNFIGPQPGEVLCIPNEDANGDPVILSAVLQWNDWEQPGNDYHLRLYRLDDEWGAHVFLTHAVSDNLQDGSPGQVPMEWINVPAHTDVGWEECQNENEAGYAWAIYRHSGSADHNFRFISSNLNHRVHSSTLSFPADSPALFSVAAVFAHELPGGYPPGTYQAPYSSEGPVLAPGGGQPSGEEIPGKPDVASFAHVATTTTSGFGGTSAAAPHVAGMLALLKQRYSSFSPLPPAQIMERLRQIALTGDNDLGDPGFDFQHGWGRSSFQVEDQIIVVQQPADKAPDQMFSPSVTVQILDTEGNPVLAGPTRTINIQIGNDPSGGQANLSPNLIWHVLEDGLVPFGGLSIDYPGEGYTLIASGGGHSVETHPFNIIETIFSDRFQVN